MPAPRVNGFSVAYCAIGGIVMYSGIKGTTLSTAFRDLTKGQPPSQNEQPVTSPSDTTGTSGGSAPPGDTGAHTQTAAHNQALAKVLAAPYGWSAGQQWADLVSLWNQESGWSNTARNASSGAYGIPQALPPTKMPAAAQAPTSDPAAQIRWGLEYIKQRYGSPSAAWAHEKANNWY